MNYVQAREIISRMEKAGSLYGTERVRSALRKLGNPQDKLRIIHVAGTNGKGTTCAFISAVLQQAGLRTGVFTSPAVFDYREQFALNGEYIPEETYARLLTEILETNPQTTAFETEFCLALLYFARSQADFAVIECGLGGREDATNAIEKKELAVIASVAYDHMHILGSTLTEIAEQKFGIVQNCPLITFAQDEEVMKVLRRAEKCVVAEKAQALSDTEFFYQGKTYRMPDVTDARMQDATLAIEVAEYLGIDAESIHRGIARSGLCGRWERMERFGHRFVLDGAHNPNALQALCNALKRYGYAPGETAMIVGMFRDKDLHANARELLAFAPHRIFTVIAPTARGTDAKTLQSVFLQNGLQAESAESMEQALQAAMRYKNIVICGSFSVLAKAKKILTGERP